MAKALLRTDFSFDKMEAVYHGKVRDVYSFSDGLLAMVASDRISAFDHVLPKGIPYKGQVLNQIAERFLDATSDIVPNWKLATPDSNVTVGKKCDPFKVEMVVRGYLAGHAWRVYKSGERLICGVVMPDGLIENDKFPTPLITPSTKADEGHDEDISREEIISQGIVAKADYEELERITLALYQRGTELAADKGLILVDTKYEFGKDQNGVITLIDEIHTPDSSRYFYADGYAERQARGEKQKQLSKEFVREWLMENGFQGLEGQEIPFMPEDFVESVSNRYIELYEHIIGEKFTKDESDNVVARVEENLSKYLKG